MKQLSVNMHIFFKKEMGCKAAWRFSLNITMSKYPN